MILHKDQLSNIPFEMAIPDEPYLDNFSQNRSQTAYYVGDRYLKFAVNEATGLVGECLWRAPTVELLEKRICHPEPGHYVITLDAKENPWEASYMTNTYQHEPVANYEENVGQLDSEGNPILWDYSWGHVINQIYYINDLKYIDGKFVKPAFRFHQHTNETVWKTVADHIEMCTRELERLVYQPEEKKAIEDCKAGWIDIRDNFQHVHHWKLKYPDMPLIKP